MKKTEVIKFLQTQDINIQSARVALAAVEIAFDSYVKLFGHIFAYIEYNKYHSFHQLTPQASLDKVALDVYKKYLKDKNSLIKKIKEHQSMEQKIDKFFAVHQADDDLLNTYKKLIKLSRPWWVLAAIVEDKGAVVFTTVVDNFVKHHELSKQKAETLINALAHPDEMSLFNLERKLFFEICLDVTKKQATKQALLARDFDKILLDKDINKKVDNYLKQFFWCKTQFYEMHELTPKSVLLDVLAELEKNNQQIIAKKYKELIDNFNNLSKDKKALLKTIKLVKADKDDLRFLSGIIYWTDQRKAAMVKDLYYIFQLLEKVAEKTGIKYSDLAIYRIKEIEELLASNKKISAKTVQQRRQGVFMVFDKHHPTIEYSGKDAQLMFKAATSDKDQTELKGMVASLGGVKKISGKIKIMLDPKDSFKAGDILVTNMTRVEFVPLMKKAKAIITDEGGIACHAAIVSREIGKPCVIGTKSATRILHDGDSVEINLINGVIKLI
jgi:phosphohistidine swiveling domain-containing protein